MKHLISVHSEVPNVNSPALTAHIKRCIRSVLDAENITVACEINVLLTDDAGIRTLNCEFRRVDQVTDVLSFPMFAFEPDAFPENVKDYLDPGSGLLPLGDIAISIERTIAQALEFGHSTEREIGYLIVHSVLHLLGYDHVDDGLMKRKMREREKTIMKLLQLEKT